MLSVPAVAVTPSVVPIRRLKLVHAQQPWSFAIEHRAAIDAHFERERRQRPQLWNGQVLLMHRHRVGGDLLEGAFLQTDFASYLAWRDWGFPETGVTNCFSMGALRSSDGAWLLGIMSSYTSAGGKIYFPAGTPDPGDVSDGHIDLAGSVMREVAEETGLTPDGFTALDGWHCVLAGPRIALMKVLQVQESAEASRRRILAYLAPETMPELAGIRIVRDRNDYDPMMPQFMITFLDHMGC